MNPFSLKNKTILITGASSGIGEACAIECDKHGASLLLLGRDEKRLNNTLRKLSNQGHRILSVDLINFENLANDLNMFLDGINEIDGLINSAGITSTLPFKIFKPNQLENILNINVTASFFLTKLLLPKLSKKGASIVFLSSVMANVGEKAKTMYSISKGAVSAGSRSLALEYSSKKIRVNTVAPGIVNTPMTKNSTYKQNKELYAKTLEKYPLGFGEPSDVANVCVFLVSNASKWITGSEIVIDGGYSAA